MANRQPQPAGRSTPVALQHDATRTSVGIGVSSPDFDAGAAIPARHTDYGEGRSPALQWKAVGGARSYAVLVEDPDAPTDKAARRRELDSGVDATLSRLYGSVNGSRELGNRARGILVFPKTLSAGFIVGGEYGDGALRSGGATRGYYRLVSGSFGWQIGAQSKSVILMFLTQDAYD